MAGSRFASRCGGILSLGAVEQAHEADEVRDGKRRSPRSLCAVFTRNLLMNFIIFNLLLLFAGFPAAIIFSVGVMAFIAPLGLLAKSDPPSKSAVYPLLGLAAAFQIYFWGLWAAFCVAITMRYTQRPDVTWDWLYWIAALGWCISLIGWFAHKEQQSSESPEAARSISRGANLYSLIAIAIAAFVLFAFMPALMRMPYGWVLQLLGL